MHHTDPLSPPELAGAVVAVLLLVGCVANLAGILAEDAPRGMVGTPITFAEGPPDTGWYYRHDDTSCHFVVDGEDVGAVDDAECDLVWR